MKKENKSFSVGDRVAFSVPFLRNTCRTSGEYPLLRGTIKEIEAFASGNQYCLILWDGKGESTALGSNLTLISRIGIDSALNT